MNKTDKVDWRRKLTSRKLWAAVAAAVITVLTVIFYGELSEGASDIIIGGISALCVYIFGEGAVDVARIVRSLSEFDVGSVDFDAESSGNSTE